SSGRPPSAAPKPVESISLKGTMSYYGKGPFAFFDSTSSEYRKVIKVSDTIAGYKVESIELACVKLAAGTNALQMAVGAELRREEGGSWEIAPMPSAAATNSANGEGPGALANSDASGKGTADSGEMDPVLKKLMERRNQENNR